jgi:predicted ATPase
MRAGLERHDAIVRSAIDEHGGYVFSTGGDGVGAAFARAADALAAALGAQSALFSERWPTAAPLRVRMGLHTGEATERDGNYFGPTLNRCARLMAAAHGGQVVCSAATAAVAIGVLPDGVFLVDLGEHRLRDLTMAEHLFQVTHKDLPLSFPPLRTLDAFPSNLPIQPTRFVGRAEDLGRVGAALAQSRLVTLTGVGGVGKTRLALHAGADALPAFPHGVWLVELAGLTDPAMVPETICTALGVQDQLGRSPEEALAEFVASRRLLVLLDNCEHVIESAAAVSLRLISGPTGSQVLATSREGLAVPGERVVPVPPLAVPSSDDPEVVLSCDAVRLFVERAVDARHDFAVGRADAPTLARLCRRLDGIPLAIELAAARTRSLSVVEIARLLDHRLSLLTRGARTTRGRHQTLRAAIDWSFDLLSEPEQRVLARASVFAGGFPLEAAVAVCDPGAKSAIDTLDHVDALVSRSMLIAEEDATTTRYRMLETIRQYAAERLEMIDEALDASRAHLEWASTFARDAGEQLRSPDDGAGMARMERELDNLRLALRFGVAIGDLEAAKTLLASVPMGALWDSRLGASMAALAKEVAPSLREPDHPVSAAVLSLLALDAALRFAGDEAVGLAERACVVARRHDDWLRTGPWLAVLQASIIAGRNERLMSTAQEALTRAIADNDPFAVAEWHAQLGIANWMTSHVEEAQRLTEIGLMLAERIGADNLIMRNAFLRGVSLLTPRSDRAVALQHFQRAVRLGEGVGGNALYGGAAWAMLLSNCGADNRNALELAHSLAANLPTPMFLADASGTLVFYNDAAANIFGKTFAEVGHMPAREWTTMLTPRDQGTPIPPEELPLAIAVQQRRPAHSSMWIRRFDRVCLQLTVTAIPLQGQRGEHLGAAAIFWQTQ